VIDLGTAGALPFGSGALGSPLLFGGLVPDVDVVASTELDAESVLLASVSPADAAAGAATSGAALAGAASGWLGAAARPTTRSYAR
jgi:hypothetical protein